MNTLLNKKSHALPPQELRFMGESDEEFLSIGDSCVNMVTHSVNLDFTKTLLDIGCGYGRLAHALWRSEKFKGDYYGIDILSKHIAFCQQNLSPLGKYNFLHIDVHNDRYNPNGQFSVSSLNFDDVPSMDVVTLFSVFTHMYIEDIVSYLKLAKKILKPNGKIIFTAFLLDNPASVEEKINSTFMMQYKLTDECYYFSEKDPLHAISYDKKYINNILLKEGFTNIKFYNGTWAPAKFTPNSLNNFQDLCIADVGN